MLLVHVVHGSPEIVGDADSICSLRAGISIGIILGATPLLAVWGSGGSLAGIMGPVNSTCWLHYLECEAI